MKKMKIKNYRLARMSICFKIFLNTIEDYNNVIEVLKQNSNEFYTFTLQKHRLSRFVLYGFPAMDDDTVKTYIEETGLNPVKVKQIIPKKRRYNDEVIYFVSFNKKDVSLNKLRHHQEIAHIICKWDHVYNQNRGPIQCSQCCMFGHAVQNCIMKPKCKYYSVDHGENTCPFKENEEKHRCANCAAQHPANSPICPYKDEYVRLKNLTNKSTKYNHNSSSLQQNDTRRIDLPSLNWSDFPALQHPNAQNKSNVIDDQLFHTNIGDNLSSNNNIHDASGKNDLFNFNELFGIFTDMITKLKFCKSKQEQLTALAEIAMKYVTK